LAGAITKGSRGNDVLARGGALAVEYHVWRSGKWGNEWRDLPGNCFYLPKVTSCKRHAAWKKKAAQSSHSLQG